MTDVYLIWMGDYSDTRVIGAFSTEANAIQACDRIARYASKADAEDMRIEQRQLDPDMSSLDQDGEVWAVWIRADGNITAHSDSVAHGWGWNELNGKGELLNTVHNEGTFRWQGIARDRDHAVKITQDHRARSLAEQHGLT